VNGVDARYLPFGRRAYAKPKGLALRPLSLSGQLAYRAIRAGQTTLLIRAAAP
jgi:hypothetical protein